MATPSFHYIDYLDEVSLSQVSGLMSGLPSLSIDQVNWPSISSYKPICCVRLAYSDKALYLLYKVKSDSVKAIFAQSQSPVCQDSCVEFFMRLPDNREYWNFEFNAIGTINASRREQRDCPTRLATHELSTIERWSSLGVEPFEERNCDTEWILAVRIPLSLLGISAEFMPNYIYANFYKCGDKTSRPHYLSWSPIHSDVPNFHRPADFAPIIFCKP